MDVIGTECARGRALRPESSTGEHRAIGERVVARPRVRRRGCPDGAPVEPRDHRHRRVRCGRPSRYAEIASRTPTRRAGEHLTSAVTIRRWPTHQRADVTPDRSTTARAVDAPGERNAVLAKKRAVHPPGELLHGERQRIRARTTTVGSQSKNNPSRIRLSQPDRGAVGLAARASCRSGRSCVPRESGCISDRSCAAQRWPTPSE